MTSTPADLIALRNPAGSEYFRDAKRPLDAGQVYCHGCDGYGQVRFRFGRGTKDWRRCLTCEGRGQIERVRLGRNRAGQVIAPVFRPMPEAAREQMGGLA